MGDIFPDRRSVWVAKQRWNSLRLCGGRRLRCGNPHLAFISHISPGPAFEKTADFMETSRKLGLILHSTRHEDLIITGTQHSGRLYISPSTVLVLCVMQEGVGCKHPRKVRFISQQITWSFILLVRSLKRAFIPWCNSPAFLSNQSSRFQLLFPVFDIS